MIIRNPHNQDVSIVIGGNEYSIEADGVVEVPEQAGRQWLKVHQFLIEEEGVAETKVEAPVLEPKTEETVVAPVEPEAPAVKETVTAKPTTKRGGKK
jgi:hypothetical protein